MITIRHLLAGRALVLTGCGYVVREIDRSDCKLPNPFEEFFVTFHGEHLMFGVADPTNDLKDATVIAGSFTLEDSSHRTYELTHSPDRTSFNGSSPYRAQLGKIKRVGFTFDVKNPRYTTPDLAVLPAGDYTLRVTVSHSGELTPLV